MMLAFSILIQIFNFSEKIIDSQTRSLSKICYVKYMQIYYHQCAQLPKVQKILKVKTKPVKCKIWHPTDKMLFDDSS